MFQTIMFLINISSDKPLVLKEGMSEEESDCEYVTFIIFCHAIFILAFCIKGIEESNKGFRKLVINHIIKIHRDSKLIK